MIIFHSDLDNTMIYSYKHDIGKAKRNVEIYQGREISFLTDKTYEMLQKVSKELLFVPTTTRSMEQYQRIDLGIGTPKYALICNGGSLLVDGVEDQRWYEKSLELIASGKEELEKGQKFLEAERRRIFEIRSIKGLFLFTKCDQTEYVIHELKEILDCSVVDVFHNGVKVYILPKKLSKGMAVRRFREYIQPDTVIAAGDSEFDVSMLNEADVALAPKELMVRHVLRKHVVGTEEQRIFSESVLEYILAHKAEFKNSEGQR